MRDRARLGHHFGHDHQIAGFIAVAQGGDVGRKLIAQNKDQARHQGTTLP